MVSQTELYLSADGELELEVPLSQETVWLTQAQMIELFKRDQSVISRHINNVFKEGELVRESNMQKMHIAHSDKPVALYSLDVIISVGYRVKSQRGVQFRQWATRTLKSHLIEGYTLNQRRLQERGVEFEQAVKLLSQTLANQQLVSTEGQAVLSVINDYARSWSLLQGYDEQSLAEVCTKQTAMIALDFQAAFTAINQLKQELIAKGEATELFGQLRGDGLASAIATIEQGFGDQLFYPNVASRAAHLLYFVIKNHSLADGNKRSGSFLFLWYLRINQHLLAKPVEQLINDNTLVALALLVAESQPDQKTLMIRLIEHFVVLKEQ
ncbi:virulence protein RhuM/Fic/DOC family protein [Endozoicomonas sp. SM1973]|uniref:Virulence protein RhuM/Fic/DOC family protein n=1 Tax=Spartinivicinus marinus TaxID=2994442 RepID=A0A853IC77_9GAMM|nr:virulence protein RhuM/Fic/DOC family protein [Spartinivicinus marinus]MCX4028617.1 virulence protein RhuM/Fic/DOC family protein [Spartinivicinus marinus]NYZ67117.1 virulence protein RhuM/Fic/DOC family protein [Spartinivicinus marinus]